MTDIQKNFIYLIKNVVFAAELPRDFKICNLTELYKLSKQQDMAHIIAYGLKENNLINLNSDLWNKHYKKQYSLAQFRVTNLQYEYENLCKTLEDAEIDYLPLKGAVIRPLYPESWMRVSSDIDILVRKTDVEKAESALVNTLGYIAEGKAGEYGYHYHVKTPSGFIMELHYALSNRNVKAVKQLEDVWNHVKFREGTNHQYIMGEDMFYMYHIFHAFKHFKDGGCGSRTVLDTWFINNKLGIDSTKCRKMLEESNLYKFALAIEIISEKWFSGENSNKYNSVEEYILGGGVYGGGNHYAAWQSETNGKSIAYYLKRAFPPYDFMYQRYPKLKGKPLLLPYYWFKRIATAFGKKDGKRTKAEIKTAWLEKEKSKQIKAMFDELGL